MHDRREHDAGDDPYDEAARQSITCGESLPGRRMELGAAVPPPRQQRLSPALGRQRRRRDSSTRRPSEEPPTMTALLTTPLITTCEFSAGRSPGVTIAISPV